MTLDKPKNIRIDNVELRYARLVSPVVNPFSKREQFELQIVTKDAAKAQEMRDAFLKVKEKDGEFTASLKRNAQKASGEDNGRVAVKTASLTDMPEADVRAIGNGSIGNVIVWAYPYNAPTGSGVSTSLTAVQVVDMQRYESADSVGFDVVGGSEEPAEDNPAAAANMF